MSGVRISLCALGEGQAVFVVPPSGKDREFCGSVPLPLVRVKLNWTSISLRKKRMQVQVLLRACADEALLVERVLAKNQVVGSKPTIRLADSAFSFPKVI
jgi:hypothetical protein